MDVVWLVDALGLHVLSVVNIDESPFLLDGVALV